MTDPVSQYSSPEEQGLTLFDYEPKLDRFLEDVRDGLSRPQKEIPSKYFYDEQGSQLFDRISQLEEYYPTRTEVAIMREHGAEMASLLGPGCLLIEYGSGNSTKTHILLDHLPTPAAYVPLDISREHLLRSAARLAQAYPELEILPVCADFTAPFELPPLNRPVVRKAVYFPGSTVGNVHPEEARQFLKHIAHICGPGGGLLIGVDLKKDRRILERAYNDQAGVTAAFNLNLLERINRELGADFRLERFRHHAFYNERRSRIEMHLVSQQAQTVHIGGAPISFGEGESILTECSYKYSVDEFAQLAASAGLRVEQVWTDAQGWFSVQYLVVD